IDATLESAPAMRQLLASLSRSGGTAAMQSSVLDAAKTLAYANVVYAGKDPASATDAAIAALAGKYDFSLPGGPRVPRDKAAAVAANADLTLRGLDAERLAVPGIFGK